MLSGLLLSPLIKEGEEIFRGKSIFASDLSPPTPFRQNIFVESLEFSRLVNILLLCCPLYVDDVHLGEAGRVSGGLLDVLLHHGPCQEVGSVLGQDQVRGPGQDVVSWWLLPRLPSHRAILPLQRDILPPGELLLDAEAGVVGEAVRQSVAVAEAAALQRGLSGPPGLPQLGDQDGAVAPVTQTDSLAGTALSSLSALSTLSALSSLPTLQSVHTLFLLPVEDAGLVVVGALRAAHTGDDRGHQEEGGDGHHDGDDQCDAAGLQRLVKDLVLLGAAVFVVGSAAAQHLVVGSTLAGAEEAIVPDTENVSVAGTEL